MTCVGEPATLTGGTTRGRAEQVRNELDRHARTLGHQEVGEIPNDQDVGGSGGAGELGCVVRGAHGATEQVPDAALGQVDRVVGTGVVRRERADLVLHIRGHDPGGVAPVTLGEALPHLQQVHRTELTVGGHDDLDVRVGVQSGEDAGRAGTGDRLLCHEVDVTGVEEATHLSCEAGIVLADLDAVGNEAASGLHRHRGLRQRRAVIADFRPFVVVGPGNTGAGDALPFIGRDGHDPGQIQHGCSSDTSGQDDAGVDQHRDTKTTVGVSARHRTELCDRTGLFRSPRRRHRSDSLGEGAAVVLVLGEQHPLGDLAAVGVAVLGAEQLVDVIALTGHQILAVTLQDR